MTNKLTLDTVQIYHLRDLNDENLKFILENHNDYFIRDEALNILNYRKVMEK